MNLVDLRHEIVIAISPNLSDSPFDILGMFALPLGFASRSLDGAR
jgi:hypothetical protein